MTNGLATWSYQVKQRYKNSTDTVVAYEITDSVIKIESMTDTGTGEINSATLVLNARKGAFLTQENLDSVGQPTTPILAEFDKIEIKLTDKNADVFRKVYEVRTLEIKKTVSEGVRLVVRLVGQERALAEVQFSKPFYYTNAWNVVKDIIEQYHDNAGSRQPEIRNYNTTVDSGTYYNDLPKWNYNNWDFGQQAHSAMEGIDEVINSLGTSISGGGAGDFFEVRFYDQFDANYKRLDLQAFSSGAQPELDGGAITTLQSSIITPHYQTTGEIQARTGTVIVGKGAMGSGSMPVQPMKWWGEFEAFLFGIPEWKAEDDDGDYIQYKKDNIVTYKPSMQELKWRALRDNENVEPNPSNSADWEAIQMGDLITDTNYSPWTNDGSTTGYKMWLATGANPNATEDGDFDEYSAFDGNMFSNDKTGSGIPEKQEYVDYYGSSTYASSDGSNGTVPVSLLYGSGAGFYRGFKMLVDSDVFPLDGAFDENSGRDRFGNKYDKAIVRFRGYVESDSAHDYNNWDVVFPQRQSGVDAIAPRGALCAVIYDADNRIFDDSYTNTTTATNIWRSYWKSETKQSTTIVPYKDFTPYPWNFFGGQNHCFHPIQSIENVEGINDTFVRTGDSTSTAGAKYGTNSAVEWTYTFGSLAPIPSATYRNSDLYYRHGAWASFRVPFPTSDYHSQTIGSQFGNNATKKEPVTVDTNNMHMTPSGNVGFNNSEAENLGQIDGLECFMRLAMTVSGTATPQAFRANFKMRCTCYDTTGNVAVQDFVIPFNSVWYHMKLPIKSFKVYRARRYWGGKDDVLAELFPPELEILEVFMWKNLRMITFQTQDSYDDQGRYAPENKTFGGARGGTVKLAIDNFHFSKQLIATSGVDTSRNLQPQWLIRPFTTNYYQLKKDVLAQKEIDGFQYQGYDITTEGVCYPNLKFGYSFYLQDDKIVKRADKGETSAGANDGTANTIKLVAKKIVYNIDGITGGQGGFTRTVTGIKRFESGA